MRKVTTGQAASLKFFIKVDFLFYKGKLYVPKTLCSFKKINTYFTTVQMEAI